MIIDEKELRETIERNSIEQYIKLMKWLYDNHRSILRDYEKSQGYKGSIEFA